MPCFNLLQLASPCFALRALAREKAKSTILQRIGCCVVAAACGELRAAGLRRGAACALCWWLPLGLPAPVLFPVALAPSVGLPAPGCFLLWLSCAPLPSLAAGVAVVRPACAGRCPAAPSVAPCLPWLLLPLWRGVVAGGGRRRAVPLFSGCSEIRARPPPARRLRPVAASLGVSGCSLCGSVLALAAAPSLVAAASPFLFRLLPAGGKVESPHTGFQLSHSTATKAPQPPRLFQDASSFCRLRMAAKEN